MGARSTTAAAAIASAALALLGGCGSAEKVSGPPPPAPPTIELRSSAFAAGAQIPKRYTCNGEDVSPPLRWSKVPRGARALALLVEDPDAPGGTFEHWALFDVDPSVSNLRAGAVPSGAEEGDSSFGSPGYKGPCPPKGNAPHRYVFSLYALRSPLRLPRGAEPKRVRAAVAEAALARGELVGRFGR
jgi:Raf kinase inhibitor-like YbhB/YbcL family protein